jgi:hypothetical protein
MAVDLVPPCFLRYATQVVLSDSWSTSWEQRGSQKASTALRTAKSSRALMFIELSSPDQDP